MLEEKLRILNDIDEEILGICEVANIEESTEVISKILGAKRKLDKAKINTKGTRATDTSMATTSNENATNKSGNITTISENSSDVTDTEGEDESELNDKVIWGLLVFRDKTISVSSLKPKLPKLTVPKF